MKVPLLDLKAQLKPLESGIKNAVNEVIDSGGYIMGPKIEQIESELAAYCDVKHAITVSSGTDALLVALMALDVGPGDIVITSPYSFFASIGVIARLNATPVLCEIDPKTCNIDPSRVEEWILKNPDQANKIKAIIPVHLYGQCADMAPLIELSNRTGIPLVEDAAQAIGATYPTSAGVRQAGSMGVMGCFSFFPSKNLGCMGDGGMVVTSDDGVAEKLRRLRAHGSKPKYYHSLIGGNFRFDPIQAAVLLVKLPYLNQWHAARRKNAESYDNLIKSDAIELPFLAYGREHHIYNQYVLTVRDRRDELREFLNREGIGNEVYYPVPFHLQECFQYLGHKKGDFPHSEHKATHTIAIPIYPELTPEMQGFVAERLISFYS